MAGMHAENNHIRSNLSLTLSHSQQIEHLIYELFFYKSIVCRNIETDLCFMKRSKKNENRLIMHATDLNCDLDEPLIHKLTCFMDIEPRI